MNFCINRNHSLFLSDSVTDFFNERPYRRSRTNSTNTRCKFCCDNTDGLRETKSKRQRPRFKMDGKCVRAQCRTAESSRTTKAHRPLENCVGKCALVLGWRNIRLCQTKLYSRNAFHSCYWHGTEWSIEGEWANEAQANWNGKKEWVSKRERERERETERQGEREKKTAPVPVADFGSTSIPLQHPVE